MQETAIRSEDETLEEARNRLPALIPDGSFPVSERVVSTGAPQTQKHRDVTAESGSLDGAREKIRRRTPEGFQALKEEVLSAGSRGTVRGTSEYDDARALKEAKGKIPAGAVITAERVCVPAVTQCAEVSAFDASAARATAIGPLGKDAFVTRLRRVAEGAKGFLGLGRKPNRYVVDVCVQVSSVEVDYRVNAKIRVTLAEVVKRPAVIEVVLVGGVDGLVATLEAAATRKDGLYVPHADRRCLFESLEHTQDVRIARSLAAYVKCHISHAYDRSGADRGPRGELLDRALECLERVGDTSVRRDLIDVIFEHVRAFASVRVPDLFGRYTSVLRALATAFTPVVHSSKVGWLDNDGYETWFRYDTEPLESALASLRAINNPVSTNLLHKLAMLPRIEVPRGNSDKGDPGVEDPTESINIREKAHNEIVRRNNPAYESGAYDVDGYYV